MKKKWILTVVALALITLPLSSQSTPQTEKEGAGIQWMSYAEGRKRSETENKKVFLVFNADWCRYCLQMEKETFRNPSVIAYVNRNFVPISVNSDKQRGIAAKYNVMGLPNLWFLTANGDRIANYPGYLSAKEMLIFLKYIKSDSYQTMSLQAFMEKGR
jgi:thioredoxin-related protein